MSEILLSWLLTYLLHSTALLGGAWLAWKLLPRETLALQEALWRTALLGGFLTASLQIGLAVEPGLGAWRLSAVSAAEVDSPAVNGLSTDPAAAAATEGSPIELVSLPRPTTLGREALAFTALEPGVGAGAETAVRTSKASFASPAVPAVSAVVTPTVAAVSWERGLLVVWALGAFALLAWLALSCVALASRLADRAAIAGGGLHILLARLQAAARMTGVALSASSRIASPMAFGWRRPEICLPDRVAREMGEEQQELVLAHELAHHARRDPVWLIVARLLESFFFFQPLNRIARRRLQEIAEYRCDDWAVERTGRPITLARCLADVAEWNLRRGSLLPVPTLAVERRRLDRRVSRLLDRSYPYPAPARPRWLVAGVALTLAVVVLMAPGVSSGHAPTPPRAPGAPEAAAAPEADSAMSAPSAPSAPSAMPAMPAPPAPDPLPAPAPRAGKVASAPALAPRPNAPLAPRAAPSPALAPMGAPAPPPPAPRAAPRSMTAPSPSPAPPPPAPTAPRPDGEPLGAPAPPPPPPADSRNGDWVLHDDHWSSVAPVPLAELAQIDDLVAITSDELAQLSDSLAGAFPAEEWAVIADHMTVAVAEVQPSPEAMAQLVVFSGELEDLSESFPEVSGRLAELSARMAELAQPDPEAMERIDRLSARLAEMTELDPEAEARIAALSRDLADWELPDSEARAAYEAAAELAAADEELSAEERAELAGLRATVEREMAQHAELARAQMDRVRAQLERELEANRPNLEEMARLREELRRELDAHRPDREEREEMDRLRAEFHRELEAMRPNLEEMRRMHEEARREIEAERDERFRRADEARHEAVERVRQREREQRIEVEELRAEVERLRAEMRRLRSETKDLDER